MCRSRRGIAHLATLSTLEVCVPREGIFCRVSKLQKSSQHFLEAMGIHLSEVLPQRKVRVVTRKPWPERRKNEKSVSY